MPPQFILVGGLNAGLEKSRRGVYAAEICVSDPFLAFSSLRISQFKRRQTANAQMTIKIRAAKTRIKFCITMLR